MTGVPAESINHDEVEDKDKFWDQLKLADQRKFTLISSSDGQGEVANENGLISGHAYSLLTIIEFDH